MPSCQTHVQFHKCKTASAPLQHRSSCIKTLWTDEYPHPRITGHCPGPRASVSPSTHRPEKVKLCLRARKMDIILLSNAGEGSFHLTGSSQVQGWTLLQNHTRINPQELQPCDPCLMCSTPGCVSVVQQSILVPRHCSSLNRGFIWNNLAWTEPACKSARRCETICASAITVRSPQMHWQEHRSSLWFISC